MVRNSTELQAGSRLYVADLITYCEREGIPFTVFEDWKSILTQTKDI